VTRYVPYEVVDVFTDTPFAGNPLAVVLDAEDLSTEQMQAIAREFNLSETTFPTSPPDGATSLPAASPAQPAGHLTATSLPAASPAQPAGHLTATYGLRIFTPQVELPFAGPPSVGSALVRERLGRITAGANVQSCGAGLLPVVVDESGATLTGGTPTVGEPLASAPFLTALGLSGADLAGPAPRFAGVGIEFAYLLVRPEALDTVVPDLAAIGALGGTGVSLVSWDGALARTRVFPAGAGIVEDPATGSAALGFGVFLAASGLVDDGEHDYVVSQGVEMGRPSTLTCRVTVEGGAAVRTTVSGSAVPVARGEIRVP
jgi:trans-2,3-dihydro-3-hydroxyanthranilate isomerase